MAVAVSGTRIAWCFRIWTRDHDSTRCTSVIVLKLIGRGIYIYLNFIFSAESMLPILSIHCSVLHYECITTIELPYVMPHCHVSNDLWVKFKVPIIYVEDFEGNLNLLAGVSAYYEEVWYISDFEGMVYKFWVWGCWTRLETWRRGMVPVTAVPCSALKSDPISVLLHFLGEPRTGLVPQIFRMQDPWTGTAKNHKKLVKTGCNWSRNEYNKTRAILLKIGHMLWE